MTGTRASKNAMLISSFCAVSCAAFAQCGQSGVPSSAGAGESVPVPVVSVGDSSTIGVSIMVFLSAFGGIFNFYICFNVPNSTFGLCLTRVEKEKNGFQTMTPSPVFSLLNTIHYSAKIYKSQPVVYTIGKEM